MRSSVEISGLLKRACHSIRRCPRGLWYWCGIDVGVVSGRLLPGSVVRVQLAFDQLGSTRSHQPTRSPLSTRTAVTFCPSGPTLAPHPPPPACFWPSTSGPPLAPSPDPPITSSSFRLASCPFLAKASYHPSYPAASSAFPSLHRPLLLSAISSRSFRPPIHTIQSSHDSKTQSPRTHRRRSTQFKTRNLVCDIRNHPPRFLHSPPHPPQRSSCHRSFALPLYSIDDENILLLLC